MQTQHRIYVGKIYRTLELLPASTVSTPRCAINWLSKTWSSPKILLTSSKLYGITSKASTEQVWKLLKQEMSLAQRVDEVAEERVSEREQARMQRKRKSESSMCRASSTLQRSTKQNSWCSFPTIPSIQCFHVCTSIPTRAMPTLQLRVPTKLFWQFWHQQQQQKRKKSISSIKDKSSHTWYFRGRKPTLIFVVKLIWRVRAPFAFATVLPRDMLGDKFIIYSQEQHGKKK